MATIGWVEEWEFRGWIKNDIGIDMEEKSGIQPLVSVVMPMYNAEMYLVEAVESILNQTLSDLEFIIIDDGSQDRSVEIVRSFQDERIQLIRNGKNIGNYPSRNIGMQMAQGKYIAVMDADDVAFPERLMRQYIYMEENSEIGIAGSWIQLSFGEIWEFSYNPESLKEMLLRSNCICHPSMFIRRKAILDYNLFYNENFCYAADYELLTRAVDCIGIRIVPEVLMMYRSHKNQISNAKYSQQDGFAGQIRLKFVKKTGVALTKQEEEAFVYLFKSENNYSEPELFIDCIDKIIEANKQSHYFDQKQLANLLASRLYQKMGRKT